MNLNELKDRAYKNAVNHGWHEEDLSNHADTIHFNQEMDYCLRELKVFGENYDKAFIDMFEYYIKDSVADELSDACIRLLDLAGLRDLQLTYTNGFPIMKMSFTEYIYCMCSFITNPDKSNVEWLNNHISYSLGWIFSWCRAKQINIEWFIEQKMKYNELRPYKHGNKKY